MHFDVVIPIRSYLKKFISYQSPVDPYFELRPLRCHISAIIFESVKNGYQRTKYNPGPLLNDKLTFRMNSSAQKYNRFFIDDQLVGRIDKRLKSMFDQQLIDYVNMQALEKLSFKDAIISFITYYGITEDDLTFDAVWKMYQRAAKTKLEEMIPEKKKQMEEIVIRQLDLFAA